MNEHHLFEIPGYDLHLDGDLSRIIAYCKSDLKMVRLKTTKNVIGFDDGKLRVYGLYREFKKNNW